MREFWLYQFCVNMLSSCNYSRVSSNETCHTQYHNFAGYILVGRVGLFKLGAR